MASPHDEDTCTCCQEWIALETVRRMHRSRGPFHLLECEIKSTPVASILAQVPYHVSIGCGCFTIRMIEPVDAVELRKALGPDWIVRQTKSHTIQRIREWNARYTTADPAYLPETIDIDEDVVRYDVLVCKRDPLTAEDKCAAMRQREALI